LETFIREGIHSTRYLAEDECRQLPHSSRYYKGLSDNILDLFDASFRDYTPEQKLDLARQTVDEVYGADDRIVSVTVSYDDGCGAEYMIADNGFEGESQDTVFSLSAEAVLKTEGNARPEDYWYDSKIYWDDLQKTGIAKQALNRVLRKLGQSKIASGCYNMLLDNTVSPRMVSPLISAMYGSAIQQKNTFLLDRLGTRIASPLLTITDKPHLPRTFGARLYDGEGVATKEQAIIENGILNTYFIDTYNALKMKVNPTIASPSVLVMDMGSRDCSELIKLMQEGIWVTGFNGGNTNGTTGDFSFGVEGFWIENGIPVKPISEMNVTGNMLDLWERIVEIGNDPFSLSSSRQIPSLLFEKVNFSGM
jgi:PmbA protein